MTVLNKDRIFEEFTELVAIPCHSTKERQIFEVVKAKLRKDNDIQHSTIEVELEDCTKHDAHEQH